MKLEIKGVMLNVVIVYCPQAGCKLHEREEVWSKLDEAVVHVLRVTVNVSERNRFKERNWEGHMVVDLAKKDGNGCVNTCLKKQEEHTVGWHIKVEKTTHGETTKDAI